MSNVAPAPTPLRAYEYTLTNGDIINVKLEDSRDDKLTPFGKATLQDRYLVGDEKPQDLFARVAICNSNDALGWGEGHAQRMYDYMSKLWFMPATPVLSNSGLKRGLPISCFAAGTPVMTLAGCKNIEDIKIGDEVITHRGRLRKVKGSRSQTAGNLHRVVIHGRSTALVVTGNHLLLTNSGWKRVDELDPIRDLVATSRELNIEESGYHVKFPEIIANGAGQFERSAVSDFNVDEDFAWALGFWFAEGSVTDIGTAKVTHGSADMCQRWVDVISSKTTLVGKVRANKTWFDGEINSKTLVEWLCREFGRGCKVKQLADWVVKLPIPMLKAFYEGAYAGDGFKTSPDRAIEMVNPPLIAGLSNILARLGVQHTLQLRKLLNNGSVSAKIYHNRNESGKTRFASWPFHDGLSYNRIATIDKLAGEVEVWDIEVDEDNSFSAAGVIAHNCFLNSVGDSMESIAEATYENIWLAAKGGGIGTCWSDVRSLDEPIDGSMTGKTSGIIPFIHWQDAQTLAISQGSLRRGSAAVYLDDRHPEIEEFIDIRRPTGGDHRRKAQNLHHGIMLSDAFMNAVLADTEEGRAWDLKSPKTGEVLKTIDARDLWIKILLARLETGEPYIVFADTVNKNLPAIYDALGLKVKQSNLCSEITLHTGSDHLNNWRTAVCCLSSLNMETMDEWMGNEQFIKDVLEFLDNVLTNFIAKAKGMSGFERAIYSAKRERSVGLGIMGFHSHLQSKMIPFESKQARALNVRVWKWLSDVAKKANHQMADERGECPDSSDACAKDTSIPPSRLTNIFSIAPTASISIIAGGTSACGEPWPANSFVQKTLGGSFAVHNRYLDKLLRERYAELHDVIRATKSPALYLLLEMEIFKSVYTVGLEEWIEDQWSSITINGGSVEHLPYLTAVEKAVFRTAIEIDQRWVIWHAGDRTEYICQAQSVNIFLPPTVEKKDLHKLHVLAWTEGLKSVYYLRSQSVKKAMAVTHVAGEMPKAKIDTGLSVYDDEPVCESCQ